MTARQFFPLLICAAFSAVLITALLLWHLESEEDAGNSEKERPPERSAAPAYAYMTPEEFVVIRGEHEVARVSRLFDARDLAEVVWTHSGNHVVLFSDAKVRLRDRSEEELILVDTRTGEVEYLPCPKCTDLAAVGKNSILASRNLISGDSGPKFVRFDLTAPGPATPLDSGLRRSDVSPFILTSTTNHIVTRTSGTEQIQLAIVHVGETIRVKKYIDLPASSSTFAVSRVGPSEEGVVAVTYSPDSGLCFSVPQVFIFDADGNTTQTDTSVFEKPGTKAGLNGGMAVNDMWWGSDKVLHAEVSAWRCDDSKASHAEMKVGHSTTLWRLKGGEWKTVGSVSATQIRQLDKEVTLSLDVPDCGGKNSPPRMSLYCTTGNLYRDTGTRRKKVGEKVMAISVPPVSGL